MAKKGVNTRENEKFDLIKQKKSNFDGEKGTQKETAAAVPESGAGSVPDVVDNLESTCFDIAADYINSLENPDEIRENNGLFVDMLKDIYDKHLKYVLNNNQGVNNRYDYSLLDRIFNIYTKLVYRIKQNKRPNILEFTLFTHINRQSLYNAVYNNTKKLTDNDIQMVKRWFTECENCLVNGSSVFEIFLLKSQYRYNDNMAPLPVDSQGPIMAAGELPDLGLQKIAKKDDTSAPT